MKLLKLLDLGPVIYSKQESKCCGKHAVGSPTEIGGDLHDPSFCFLF